MRRRRGMRDSIAALVRTAGFGVLLSACAQSAQGPSAPGTANVTYGRRFMQELVERLATE